MIAAIIIIIIIIITIMMVAPVLRWDQHPTNSGGNGVRSQTAPVVVPIRKRTSSSPVCLHLDPTVPESVVWEGWVCTLSTSISVEDEGIQKMTSGRQWL